MTRGHLPEWLFFCSLLFACSPKENEPKLRIGLSRRPGNALVCLAEQETQRRGKRKTWNAQYFEESDSALNAMHDGLIDVAVAAPTSFYRYALKHQTDVSKTRILAGINNVQNAYVFVSLKSSGIVTPKDIRGRKLGHLGEGTGFFKNYFFLTEGINESQVQQIVFANSSDLISALENKRVDAVVVPDAMARRADPLKHLFFFSKVHELSSQIITTQENLGKKQDLLKSLIDSLLQVEKEIYLDRSVSLEKLTDCYPDAHPDSLKELIDRRELRVLLDESLLAQYNLYEKWVISKPDRRLDIPFIRTFDARDLIAPEILKSLDFRRVLIK